MQGCRCQAHDPRVARATSPGQDGSITLADKRPAPPAPAKKPLSPKNLLLSKWTAVTPRHKERHFIVNRVVLPEPPAVRIEQVELEAVHSKRSVLLHCRELTDAGKARRRNSRAMDRAVLGVSIWVI